MSYTMTIESPEKAAWFEQQRAKMSDAELGALFVVFLKQHFESERQSKPAVSPREKIRSASIIESLSGAVSLPDDFDDKNILGRAALEKYERIS